MKPYGRTTADYGDTGCCPGHDRPLLRKWAGKYSGHNCQRKAARIGRQQNRRRRRTDRQRLESESC